MSIQTIAKLLFSFLTQVLGTDWDVEDIAEELRQLKANPPSKAQLPLLREELD